MTEVTQIQLQQDGAAVLVVLDKKVGRQFAVVDLIDDVAITRFKEDYEHAQAVVNAACKRHMESNVVVGKFDGPRRPLGIAALTQDVTNA